MFWKGQIHLGICETCVFIKDCRLVGEKTNRCPHVEAAIKSAMGEHFEVYEEPVGMIHKNDGEENLA